MSTNRRDLWRPKLAEVAEQCASCPFRKGNDAELSGIVKQLCKTRGRKTPVSVTPEVLDGVRRDICDDLKLTGDFACHVTVYGPKMKMKPVKGHRQCVGATEFFKAGGAEDKPKQMCKDCGATYEDPVGHRMFCPARTCDFCQTTYGRALDIYDSRPTPPLRKCDRCMEGEFDN